MRYRPVDDTLNFNAKEMTDIWQSEDVSHQVSTSLNDNNNNNSRMDDRGGSNFQAAVRMDDQAGLIDN